MPLTKQYLRYVAGGVFGVVASPAFRCIVYLDRRFQIRGLGDDATNNPAHEGFVAVAACESVVVWDPKTGNEVTRLVGDKSAVTAVSSSPDNKRLAVGYEDGAIRMFDLSADVGSPDYCVTFQGHKKGINAVNFDSTGSRLASASKDATIIVWDVVAECGVVRLKGHKDAVTQTRFCDKYPYLISSSKDALLKFWDLDTNHCFKTVPGHRTEVWDFDFVCDQKFIVSGSADNEIRLWEILHRDRAEDDDQPESRAWAKKRKIAGEDEDGNDDDDDEDKVNFETEETEEDKDWVSCLKVASLLREGKERVVQVKSDALGRVIGLHGNDNLLELFLVRTDEEMEKLRKKRRKKMTKKKRKNDDDDDDARDDVRHEERLARLKSIKPTKSAGGGRRAKIKGFDLRVSSTSVSISLLMHNNLVSFFTSPLKPSDSTPPDFRRALGAAGHRSDVRALALSSDGFHLLTASAESLKVWTILRRDASNFDSAPTHHLHPISTLPCEYALDAAFLPGDRHAVVAAKSGVIQLFDVAAALPLESLQAHAPFECWSISLSPDRRGLVTGGGDKTVKFWDFELVSGRSEEAEAEDGGVATASSSGGKQLTLLHKRTLQLDESVLGVKYTPDGKLVAAALLDSTVKIFFVDTLKFFLSLYGHKLPVLAMDVSSDSTLIATASADRNVKIWGLDFGDCHKSIFAHEDSILDLRFIPKTHLFFSCGKDGKINQWDADKFEKVITLEGHQDDVLAIAVTQNGGHLISAGRDKSIRLWNKTKEIVIPAEEEEEAREREFEGAAADAEEGVVPGEDGMAGETGRAGRRTLETVKMAERLLEALEIYEEETNKLKEVEGLDSKTKITLHPMFIAYNVSSPLEFVVEAMKRVKAPELEESLLILPFHKVALLLNLLLLILTKSGHETELCVRVLVFLLKVHHGQVSTSKSLLPVVEDLKRVAQERTKERLDQAGFNMAGLKFVQRRLEADGLVGDEAPLFYDATAKFKQKIKKAKKSKMEGEDAVKTAAILTIV